MKRPLIAAIALFLSISVHGQEKFHPVHEQAAYGHFLVRLSDDVPAEETDAVANQMAKTYGGRLEPFAAQGFRGFAIVLSSSRARLLSNDPRVIRVDEQQTSEAVSTVVPRAAPPPPALNHAAPLLHPVDNGSGTWSSGTYLYDAAGDITDIGSDHYVYDTVGRLLSGTANRGGSRQEYSYDSFGNRLSSVTFGAPCLDQPCGSAVLVDRTTNRITDHAANYDSAGNLTSYDPVWEPLNTPQPFHYVYDAAGMISSTTTPPISTLPGRTFEYVYTANDERIAFSTGDGTWRVTLRDLGGKVIREVTAYVPPSGTTTWGWDRDHIFRNGSLLATVSALGTEQFHLDHLGTPRLVTNASGAKTGFHVYYPFGEELNLSQTEYPAERLKFTGHERDGAAVGGLDYMHARYYAGPAGRFLSADPVVGNGNEPQSWNRYTYVSDNPINATDPTGKLADGTLMKALLSRLAPAASSATVGDIVMSGIIGWHIGRAMGSAHDHALDNLVTEGHQQQAEFFADLLEGVKHGGGILIGETMDRVTEAALKTGSVSLDVIPPGLTPMDASRAFVSSAIARGVTILDIREDPERPARDRSANYAVEVATLSRTHQRQFVTIIGVRGVMTPVYRWVPKKQSKKKVCDKKGCHDEPSE